MIYLDTNNNKKVTKTYLKSCGFPDNDELLKTIGIYPIIDVVPTYDIYVEKIITDGIPTKIDNNYYQNYKTIPLSEREIEEKLSLIYEEKIKEILQASDDAMNDYMKLFSEVEKHTWYKQEEEINAYNKDNTTPTPMLDALAEARGIDRMTMLNKTNAKVELFKTIAVKIIGKQQAYEDMIKNILNSNKPNVDKIHDIRNIIIDNGLS